MRVDFYCNRIKTVFREKKNTQRVIECERRAGNRTRPNVAMCHNARCFCKCFSSLGFPQATLLTCLSASCRQHTLGPLATDAAGELDVLGHDGNTLGVDGAEVGVLEDRGEVGFRGLLQGHDGV